MNIKKRLMRTATLVALGLLIGGFVGWFQYQMEAGRSGTVLKTGSTPTSNIAGANIGGPFTLIDHNGNEVTEKDFADQYKLIYFGFTFCPAICPTELQKITQVLNSFEPRISDKIQPILISIDPERDTPDVLKDYVSLFHPRLIGLTGTQPQVDFVKKGYRVFSTKVQHDELSDYTIDHSTFVYFMSPDDQLLGIYRMADTVDFIKNDILTKMTNLPESHSALTPMPSSL